MALSVTSAPWQQVNMPALDLRRFLSFGIAEGVGSSADMAVSQRGAGANMSVDIAAGEAIVTGDAVTNQGKYYAFNDAVFNLTGFTAAHATLPRIDRVTLRVRDTFHDASGSNDVAFVIVTGTATSGANLSNLTGAASIPTNQLLLANILVPATATSITTGNIDTAIRPVSSFGGGAAVPTGALQAFAGTTAPAGWLVCDGTPVSRTTYATLFAVVATAYGAGDGSTTFNLPDMRGRSPVGQGTHADVDNLGDSDGVAVGSRRPKHKHTVVVTDSGHAHNVAFGTSTGSGGASPTAERLSTNVNYGTSSATTGVGVTAGPQTGAEPTDSSGYLTVAYIIKY